MLFKVWFIRRKADGKRLSSCERLQSTVYYVQSNFGVLCRYHRAFSLQPSVEDYAGAIGLVHAQDRQELEKGLKSVAILYFLECKLVHTMLLFW